MMEAWEDPPEDAESWLPTPAIRIALARQESSSLSHPVVQGECDVAERKNGEELLISPKVLTTRLVNP